LVEDFRSSAGVIGMRFKIRIKGQVTQLIPAILIPLSLIIFAAVFVTFQNSSSASLQNTITNETIVLGSGALTGTVASYPIEGFIGAYNGSDGSSKAVALDITDLKANNTQSGIFNCGGVVTTKCNTTIKISYYGHDRTSDSWITFEKVTAGTYQSYNLASMLPYIIIAMVVIGLIIGGFVIAAR